MAWKKPVYVIQYTGFFMPLSFHEFHKLFWIHEIKFVKCSSYIKISDKHRWICEILNANIQFVKNPWKYTSVKITLYTVRVSYHCTLSHSFHFNSHLKQLYISNKMEQFSYKGVCVVYIGIHVLRHWIEKLACAIDKRLWVICYLQ